MLPDFPDVRKHASEFLMKLFQRRVSQRTGVLQEMKPRQLEEGDTVEFHRVDGTVDHVKMNCVRSELKLQLDRLQDRGLQAVLEALDKTATDLAQKQSKFFFRRLEEICDEAGQTADGKGRPMSFDVIIELLDKMDIDFDDVGNPVLPTPVDSRGKRGALDKLEITDEQNERFRRLIEEKRFAWRDRESNRRLVD
jgi:hypothetical protein